jgi:hypothetical protein
VIVRRRSRELNPKVGAASAGDLLMPTECEQVRLVVAAIEGDLAEVDDIHHVLPETAYPSQVEQPNRVGHTDQTLVGETCLMSARVPRCAKLPKCARPAPTLRQAIIGLRSRRAACGTSRKYSYGRLVRVKQKFLGRDFLVSPDPLLGLNHDLGAVS